MNRHSLLDDDDLVTTPTMEHGSVFGDEHEVDDFDMVADGFRPNNDGDTAGDMAMGREPSAQGDRIGGYGGDVPVRTVSAHYSSRPVTPSAPSRNSMHKSRDSSHRPNPFGSPDDDDHEERRESLQFEPDAYGVRRSVSTTSSHIFARTNSPRFGASGPSHPYGMYQQGTMPRSPSVATASTVRPSEHRMSSLPGGPQHPYSMYPQGVEEDLYDEDDEQQPLQHNPIPVGFPGVGQNFVRRFGPDGEEQDIIGADGHAEQLPPYSRYPDEGPEKMPLLFPTALHSRAPIAGTDPSMPLMHTLIQPASAPQSMTDVSQISNRHNSLGSAERLRPVSDDDDEEDDHPSRSTPKVWKDASWKEKARIKFCGLPFWCYILALVIITLIATVLGIVIGGFVANHNRNTNSKSGPTVTFTTSLYDASIIASPTAQAPSSGTYALSLGPPQQTQAACLVQEDQQVAWDCNIAPNTEIALSVGTAPGGTQGGAQIFYAADIQIAYGAQASYMNTSFSTFLTVTDMDDTNAGPAFYFSAFYDKVVVVPEDQIDVTTKKFKRDRYPPPGWLNHGPWGQQKQVAQASDKPWFCVWNGTLLEGFIYVDRGSNWTGTPTSHYTPVTLSSAASSSTITPASNVTSSPGSTYATSSTQSYRMDATSYSQTTSAPAPSASSGDDDDDNHSYGKRQSNPPPTSAPITWSTLPVYPYLVKLEERRVPNNPIQPYCQQYQILDNGEANWVGTGPQNSQPIIITLDEQDPSFSAYESAGIGEVARKVRLRANAASGPITNGCHCEWISGGLMPGQSGAS